MDCPSRANGEPQLGVRLVPGPANGDPGGLRLEPGMALHLKARPRCCLVAPSVGWSMMVSLPVDAVDEQVLIVDEYQLINVK